MPKPALIAIGVVAAAVVLGAAGAAMSKDSSNDTAAADQQRKLAQNPDAKINDPYGEYKLFSDASITKAPTKGEVIGGGKAISIGYDGSKTKANSSLFYTLYFVDKHSSVRELTNSSFTGINKGTFTTSDKVFNSDANGRPGFLKVYFIKSAASDPAAGGSKALASTPIALGMYAVTIKCD
ncbi:hypothetical protein BH11CYA1_BH11CYA1_46590 [soil metagenome]